MPTHHSLLLLWEGSKPRRGCCHRWASRTVGRKMSEIVSKSTHALLWREGCLTCYLRDQSWGYWPDLRGWSRGRLWPAFPRRRTDPGLTQSLTSSVIFRQPLCREERITSMSSMLTVPTWLSLAENICKVGVWHELGWWKWLGRKSRTWRVTRKCKNINEQMRNFAAPTRIQQTRTCINIKGKPSIKYSF